jgi:hypothetical protein
MEMINSGIMDAYAVSCFCTTANRGRGLHFNLKTLYQDDNVFILADKMHGLSLWTSDFFANNVTRKLCNLSHELFHDTVIKMIPVHSSGILIVLGSSSWVYLVDLLSFTMKSRFQMPNLLNINLIEFADEQSPKLMALFEKNSSEKFLQWLDIKTWLPMSNALPIHGEHVLFSPHNGSPSLLSLGGSPDKSLSSVEQSSQSGISAQVLTLEESDVLSVVSRLIAEGKHNEAKSFLQTKESVENHSSLENYYKLCLQNHCHSLSIENTLSNIKDAKFLKSFAANYNEIEESDATPNQPSTLRIIELVQHALSLMEASDIQSDMINDLKRIYQRFITFSLIERNKRSFWGNDWHIFRTSNMQYSLQHAIASKDIGTALLLIKRHFQGMLCTLDLCQDLY